MNSAIPKWEAKRLHDNRDDWVVLESVVANGAHIRRRIDLGGKLLEKDAHLISAAHDMAFALDWLTGLAEQRPADSAEQIILALAAGRAALSKARGRE